MANRKEDAGVKVADIDVDLAMMHVIAAKVALDRIPASHEVIRALAKVVELLAEALDA